MQDHISYSAGMAWQSALAPTGAGDHCDGRNSHWAVFVNVWNGLCGCISPQAPISME